MRVCAQSGATRFRLRCGRKATPIRTEGNADADGRQRECNGNATGCKSPPTPETEGARNAARGVFWVPLHSVAFSRGAGGGSPGQSPAYRADRVCVRGGCHTGRGVGGHHTHPTSPRARCPRALDSRRCGNDETLHRPRPPSGRYFEATTGGSCEVPASAGTTGAATRGVTQGSLQGEGPHPNPLPQGEGIREVLRLRSAWQHHTHPTSPRARCPRALDSRRCGNDETLHRPRPLSGRYFRSNDGGELRGSCLHRNDGAYPTLLRNDGPRRARSQPLPASGLRPRPHPDRGARVSPRCARRGRGAAHRT